MATRSRARSQKKTRLKLPISAPVYILIVLLPLIIWSHPASSVVLLCLSNLWMLVCVCLCRSIKARNVIHCSVWTKPTRLHPSKVKKWYFLWHKQCFWQLPLCFCHLCFSYKHLSVVCICIHQHENQGAQWQQSCQYLTHCILLILLVSSCWVTLS